MVTLCFQIGLHVKDRALLEQLKLYFDLGSITKHGSMVWFKVQSKKDLAKIIDHFQKYPLISQKAADYMLFKKAYRLFLTKEHLAKEGLNQLVGIKASMN